MTLELLQEQIMSLQPDRDVQEKLRENEKGSRFVNLLGDFLTVEDIRTFIQKELPVIEDKIKEIDQKKSAQKHVDAKDRVAIRETDTVMHKTILDSFKTEDTTLDVGDLDLETVKDMTPREWRMMLGILEDARADLTKDLRHGADINGLKRFIIKIESHLDNIPVEERTINGWPMAIYDRWGVTGHVNPDHSYIDARREKNKKK